MRKAIDAGGQRMKCCKERLLRLSMAQWVIYFQRSLVRGIWIGRRENLPCGESDEDASDDDDFKDSLLAECGANAKGFLPLPLGRAVDALRTIFRHNASVGRRSFRGGWRSQLRSCLFWMLHECEKSVALARSGAARVDDGGVSVNAEGIRISKFNWRASLAKRTVNFLFSFLKNIFLFFFLKKIIF